MTSGPGEFKVDPEELRAFARGLADRGGQIDQAKNDAAGVNLGAQTFGQLLGHLTFGLNAHADEMVGNIGELSASVDRAVSEIHAAANNYEHTNQGVDDNLKSIGGM